MDYSRYAIYFAPEVASPLALFGASWLGWDADAGSASAHPQAGDLPIAEVTAAPRKYGFHGTLKPPFRLAEGMAHKDLEIALARFADQRSAFEIPPLQLVTLGNFLALTPSGPSPALKDLAFACVATFDPFRAPLSEAELAKRRATGLSDRQDALLESWGYPYVDDEFRFHLTLSGALDAATLTAARTILTPLVAPLCQDPLQIRELCLFGEAEDGRFHVLRRFPLQG
ncbi:MAG: DUF1045 domain-containing protein [Pseudomonadota bacterium]